MQRNALPAQPALSHSPPQGKPGWDMSDDWDQPQPSRPQAPLQVLSLARKAALKLRQGWSGAVPRSAGPRAGQDTGHGVTGISVCAHCLSS